MMASTQVLFANDANEAVIPENCKPPTGFSQMTVSKICRDDFFDCLKMKAEFCVWGKEEVTDTTGGNPTTDKKDENLGDDDDDE